MTSIAIATMVIICGIVWGGFATLAMLAIRSEKNKQSAGKRDS